MENYSTDNSKGIISFSLESISNMPELGEPGDQNFRGCLFAHRDLNSTDQFSIFRYPCRINAYLAFLCTAGSARFVSNLNKYTIAKNCLYISSPNDIIQLESMDNCEFYIIALNDDFANQIKIDLKKVLSVFLEIQKKPLIEMQEEEAGNFEEMYCILLREINFFKGTRFYVEIIMSYISLAVYKVCSIISRCQGLVSDNKDTITHRNEEYYNKFITLLNQNFKEEHAIGFYASEVCITPKYLTTLVKKVSGKSATHWINGFIVMEAKHLLKYSKMSVQEISDYLCFPNQSFFTQYFKRQIGMTPTKYRITP